MREEHPEPFYVRFTPSALAGHNHTTTHTTLLIISEGKSVEYYEEIFGVYVRPYLDVKRFHVEHLQQNSLFRKKLSNE